MPQTDVRKHIHRGTPGEDETNSMFATVSMCIKLMVLFGPRK